uniref:Uncharacterized protein n=1 Tax=Rhizophora mucronata TaxID=61149 RepID=A0A2P2IIH7_RHIMU
MENTCTNHIVVAKLVPRDILKNVAAASYLQHCHFKNHNKPIFVQLG